MPGNKQIKIKKLKCKIKEKNLPVVLTGIKSFPVQINNSGKHLSTRFINDRDQSFNLKKIANYDLILRINNFVTNEKSQTENSRLAFTYLIDSLGSGIFTQIFS